MESRLRARWERIDHILTGRRSAHKASFGDPWETTKHNTSDWPLHAPHLDQIDLERLSEITRTGPYATDVDLAIRMLHDPTIWEPAGTLWEKELPKSRISKSQAAELVAAGILTPFKGKAKAWGILSTKLEPQKQRLRPISDMLWSNATLPEARDVKFSTIEQQTQRLLQHTHTATTDFKGWYFQIPVGPLVQPYLCVNVGGDILAHTRGPMGHKWFVFIAHTFTRALAHTNQCQYDVIIDNVEFAGSEENVRTALHAFKQRCAYVGATLSEDSGVKTTSTFRGVEKDYEAKTLRLKETWAQKLNLRLKVIEDASPTTAQLWSLGGMMAWARTVTQDPVFDNYATWRVIAKTSTHHPKARHRLETDAQKGILEIRRWLDRNPPRKVKSSTMQTTTLVITDGALTRPVGRWAGLIATSSLRALGGLYPTPLTQKHNIADIEMAAILLTIVLGNIHNSEVQILCDNQPVVNIITKGRSSAPRLHQQVLRLRRESKSRNLSMSATYIPSGNNPADNLSRGREFTENDRQLVQGFMIKNGMASERKVSNIQLSNLHIISPWDSLQCLCEGSRKC